MRLLYAARTEWGRTMQDTSASLLERLRAASAPGDWERFVAIYESWINDWLRRHGLQDHDAADLTQEVLATVAQEMPTFRYDPQRGRFRAWLRTITVHRLQAFWKSRRRQPVALDESQFDAAIEQLRDPASDLSRAWDREHDAHVLRRALALIQPEFTSNTWAVFRRVVIEGEAVAAVAKDLDMTPNAVYIAQSRVLSRLRQEIRGFCD